MSKDGSVIRDVLILEILIVDPINVETSIVETVIVDPNNVENTVEFTPNDDTPNVEIDPLIPPIVEKTMDEVLMEEVNVDIS